MVTVAQMREIDRVAVDETGPNLLQMMENAGRSLAELTLRRLERPAARSTVVVLAGTGGNGGGGIASARHLASRVDDVILCVTDVGRLSPAARVQLAIFRHTAGREVLPAALEGTRPDLVVDAVLGYGLSGAPRGPARELVEWAGNADVPVLSLDVPSGIDSDTATSPGVVVRPVGTLTLALPKKGLLNAATGDLWLADLGIPAEAFRRAGVDYQVPFDDRFMVPLKKG